MNTGKIVVSVTTAKLALNALNIEREQLEEKLLTLSIEIEEIERAIATPVPVLEKKPTEFTLTSNRVFSIVRQHTGKSVAQLADIVALDLNLQKNDIVLRKLKSNISGNLAYLKKKKMIVDEDCQEIAAKIYFPAKEEPCLN